MLNACREKQLDITAKLIIAVLAEAAGPNLDRNVALSAREIQRRMNQLICAARQAEEVRP